MKPISDNNATVSETDNKKNIERPLVTVAEVNVVAA